MASLRVLVIGGYGFFGRHLVERLAARPGLQLIVAGRSVASAQALVDRLRPGAAAALEPCELDAMSPALLVMLIRLAPAIVVHTGGPFQGQDYRVARACIAAAVHYIDLADGRDFVAGIDVLDADARRAGVAVIAGASSVPALSGAAADELARGMSRVQSIDIGISPGNRTERGLATVQAVLGCCGRPLPVHSGASDGERIVGWRGSVSHRYPAPVGRRWLSPCDVPDLTVLPPRYAGVPTVRFSAGLELPLLHSGINAMAALAAWGWVRDWSAHARPLAWAADRLIGFGSDTGAMHVRVDGIDDNGGSCSRLWQLVATHGHGPYVPTLAAAALVRKLQQSEALAPGARPCVGLLTLTAFEREAAGLRITMAQAQPVFVAALGADAYARLPAAVRRFHASSGRQTLHGEVETAAPASAMARLLAWCLGSPREARRGPLRFELDASPAGESWTRVFPDRTMSSQLHRDDAGGSVIEQLGPLWLRFAVHEVGGALEMRLAAMRCLGIPWPRMLLPKVVARETGDDERLQFEVSAALPLIGQVAAYRGHLVVPGAG